MRCCIEHRIDQLKLGDRVTLTGSLEPAELDKSYRMAAVVVLASFSEGVPVVLMEAMRRGLPVVATCIGGVPELVAHRTSGLLVPAGDSAALANALQEVLTNTPLARALGERAALAVRKEFDVERSAVRLVELFQPSRRTIPSPADVETIVCGPRVTTADS
jgi:glycosyltransferase involved in cell wall biosynthesis